MGMQRWGERGATGAREGRFNKAHGDAKVKGEGEVTLRHEYGC